MPSSSSYPSLPIELIENIISLLWSSSLSADERITFMTSSTLVNKTWSHVFLYISLKDAHIPSLSYCNQYLRILCKESPSLNDEIQSLPEMLCRSINLKIEHTPIYGYPDTASASNSHEPPMGKVLSMLLYFLKYYNLPNLRTISIEYLNTSPDDIFHHHRFMYFPNQVTDLELTFSFDPRTPQWIVDRLRRNQVQHNRTHWGWRPCLRSVRRLWIKGGSEAFVTDMVTACPGMEMLELDLLPGLKTRSASSEPHLVNLLKREVNLEEGGNESVPPNRLTITSSVRTYSLDHWEGVQTKVFEDICRFQRLDSF